MTDGRPAPGESTVLRRMVGAQLRRFREAAGVTPDEAAYEIRGSRSKISRMETGRVAFKPRDVRDLLLLYGVEDEKAQAELLSLAREASKQNWWAQYGDIVPDWLEAYLGLEAAAELIRSFECQFVHGLFQTEEYARAVTLLGRSVSAEEAERRVIVRRSRQDLLHRPDPPRIWAVMDEAVLRRPLGGSAVMRGQLQRLLDVVELPHVSVQVVPFSRGGHAGAGGAFTVLRFAEPELPDVVYIEQLTGALYLERRAHVEQYLQVMNVLSAQALSPAATARELRQILRET